jgi:Tfp pilus assembly protein PilF
MQKMNIRAKNLVNKALLLLDRDDFESAKKQLRDAIAEAEISSDPVSLVRALVVLGDCLHSEGDASAGDVHLQKALSVDLEDKEEVVEYEIQRARELLRIE